MSECESMQKTAAKRCPGDKGNKNKEKKSTPPARQSTGKSTGKKKQAKNTVKPKVLSFAEKMRVKKGGTKAKVQKVTTKAPQKAKQKVTQKKANNYNSGPSTISSGKKGTTSNLDSHNKKKKEL